ncbi:rifin PIR protein, putative [Plasmodium reichenowi]|uniref:Rifin PIR protein, putative n=1 Tax=Plasmodium reichenowi TaxID=5854 RepID=A0A2P9DIX1_PLARE|nr:rifin PIR protein, putative [Plasmodium reichenowi]
MKLHCTKILLFFLQLSILVTSYHVYNKYKPYITPLHTPRYTSRVLSECDIQSSIHDKYVDMKSVKEQFDDRTSERLREYDERIKEKRQKRKEERDRNIQKIIEEDKREKSLSEKIERGCLRCGCALGGGVLPVWGLVGGLWYATLSQYVTKTATEAGIQAGIATVVSELKDVASPIDISGVVNAETYLSRQVLITSINREIQKACVRDIASAPVCTSVEGSNLSSYVPKVLEATTKGMADAKTVQADKLAELTAKSSHIYSAIGYSIFAILIIVLIMIIIYLILRYRRKTKMKKKAQYTKLLNE